LTSDQTCGTPAGIDRVVWGTPVTNFSCNTFGQIGSQANTPSIGKGVFVF
jgi:hypothetical protein